MIPPVPRRSPREGVSFRGKAISRVGGFAALIPRRRARRDDSQSSSNETAETQVLLDDDVCNYQLAPMLCRSYTL